MDHRDLLRHTLRSRPLPAPGLVLVHTHDGGEDVVAPIGELDLATVPRLVRFGSELLRGGTRRLVLDLGEVGFLDPIGLAGLVNLLRCATRTGAELVLAHPRPHVVRLLRLTRLDREFTVVEAAAAPVA